MTTDRNQRRWRARRCALSLLMPALFTISCGQADEDLASEALKTHQQSLGIGEPGGGLQGTIRASYSALGSDLLPIPDAQVFARNVVTSADTPSVSTDIYGRFRIGPQPPGFYKLCWSKPGFTSTCGATIYNIKSGTIHVGYLPITAPSTSTSPGKVRGKVELGDGSLCLHFDEFFGVKLTARVDLLSTSNTVLQTALATSDGEFLLTQVPSSGGQLRIRCAKDELLVPLDRDLDRSGGKLYKFQLKNHRPYIAPLNASLGGKDARKGVAPGATIALQAVATDPDGDQLRFTWKVPRGAGILANAGTTTPQWTLPANQGTFYAYVLVDDRRGGSITRRVGVRVRQSSSLVLFTGNVRGDDGSVIDGATVNVGSQSTVTDARGYFELKVREADDYVINISKANRAEFSKRLVQPTKGQTFLMTSTAKQKIDPAADNVIVDNRERWLRGDQKTNGKRRGGRVMLPAGALDLTPRPVGDLFAYVATIDPTTEMMVGDFSAINSASRETALVSLGAMFIEIRDSIGQKYNLARGKTAIVEIPVQDSILSNERVPTSIDSWTYDLTAGRWKELPKAGTLVDKAYRFEVSSFSTKNADIEKADPACIRVQLDSTLPTDGSLQARVDVTVAPGSVRRYELTLDDENNVLYNLPTNAPYVAEIFQQVDDQPVLKATLPGNTGAGWGGVGVPPYPYAACSTTTVEATAVNVGAINFLTFKGVGSEGDAQAYYAAIDPPQPGNPGQRETLGEFWDKNGFGADGVAATRTSFINHNDLGFGRDMYCRTNGLDVACYVTNYGEPDQTPGNFGLAQAADRSTAVATVAMEYSPVEGQDPNRRIVKFYAYGGGEAASMRITSADLDKAGPKFLPNLCLNCHGGDYFSPAAPDIEDIDMGSSFREFDIYSFRDGTPGDVASGLTGILAQEANFLTQNQIVRASEPSAAIQELIELFYPGGALPFDASALPSGWEAATTGDANTEGLYLNVVGKSCRTCHVALGDGISWNTYQKFRAARSSVSGLVCGAKLMPHANITFKNFWLSTSPAASDVIESFTGPGWPAIGACDP